MYHYIHHILPIFRSTVSKRLLFLLKVTEIKLPVTYYFDKLKSENWILWETNHVIYKLMCHKTPLFGFKTKLHKKKQLRGCLLMENIYIKKGNIFSLINWMRYGFGFQHVLLFRLCIAELLLRNINKCSKICFLLYYEHSYWILGNTVKFRLLPLGFWVGL